MDMVWYFRRVRILYLVVDRKVESSRDVMSIKPRAPPRGVWFTPPGQPNNHAWEAKATHLVQLMEIYKEDRARLRQYLFENGWTEWEISRTGRLDDLSRWTVPSVEFVEAHPIFV
jgi:hypothetical protein